MFRHNYIQKTNQALSEKLRTITATLHSEDDKSKAAFPQQDDCKTRNDTNYCINKKYLIQHLHKHTDITKVHILNPFNVQCSTI